MQKFQKPVLMSANILQISCLQWHTPLSYETNKLVFFLSSTTLLYIQSTSLHPDVQMATGEFNAGDWHPI